MRRNPLAVLFFLFFLAAVTAQFSALLYQRSAAWGFSEELPETDAFRQMQLSLPLLQTLRELSEETGTAPGEILTVALSGGEANLSFQTKRMRTQALSAWRSVFLLENRDGFEAVEKALSAIWNDVQCFPVDAEEIVYENSWMFERTYGGRRGHEGADLIPPENVAGYYPVVSMTDGTVEKVGWLKLGGWRIGIRSPDGGYFYYAHLDSYAQDFSVGDTVTAGETLGYMGDSGYGPEGTRGQFAVHLHLGIYICTVHYGELSVNPYWVLRYAEELDSENAFVASSCLLC